jgi:lipopolysaccharide transport system permease protein
MNHLIVEILKKRRQILGLALADLQAKVRGSVLGIFLIVLYPIFFVAIYVGAYSYAFKATLPGLSSTGYILYVLTGLVPFLYFSEVVGSSTQIFRSHASVLKNTPVTHAVICTVLALTALPPVIIILGAASLLLAIKTVSLLPALLFIYSTACLVLISVSLAIITSILCAVLKDLVTAIPLLLLTLLIMTPISYSLDRVPAMIRIAALVNPILPVIETYRSYMLNLKVVYLGLSPPMATLIMALVLTYYAGNLSRRATSRVLDLT